MSDSSATILGRDNGNSTAWELIARLEAATEGSRELDCLIAWCVGWKRWTPSDAKAHGTTHKKHGGWIHPDDVRDGRIVWDSLHGTEIWRDPPSYTVSLDAARALVPDGYDWRVGCLVGGGRPIFNAVVTTPELAAWNWDTGCDSAAGPAMALCIAALKARTPAKPSQD